MSDNFGFPTFLGTFLCHFVQKITGQTADVDTAHKAGNSLGVFFEKVCLYSKDILHGFAMLFHGFDNGDELGVKQDDGPLNAVS